jgi:lipopolysaccharide transport protein LptA
MKKFLILLLAASRGLAWAQTNAPVQKPKPPPTEINSDSADFDLNSRRAVYHGHVEVISATMKLKCERLVVDLPMTGGQPTNIVAETNVVIDFIDEKGQTNHVTSAKAVYAYHVANSVTNKTVTFTGDHPRVETGEGWLTGEPMVWDFLNKKFHADNQRGGFNQNFNSGGTNASLIKLF